MRRLTRTKRRICIGAFTLVAAPLVLASVASACTQLKNLTTNPSSGAAGATIRLGGTNYVKGTNIGPVEIRLDSRSSAPIATLPVDSINGVGGVISLDVTIPADATLGYHTLIATQYNTSTGALLNGFPVRASYRVVPVAAAKDSTASAAEGMAASVASSEPVAPPAAPSTGTAAAAAAGSTEIAPASAALVGPVPAPDAASASVAAEAGTGAPTAPAAASGGGSGGGSAQAVLAVETSTPPLGTGSGSSSAVVTSGLMSKVAERSTSTLPEAMLAFGAAIVLLSLAASLTSGRSVLSGRRTSTLV